MKYNDPEWVVRIHFKRRPVEWLADPSVYPDDGMEARIVTTPDRDKAHRFPTRQKAEEWIDGLHRNQSFLDRLGVAFGELARFPGALEQFARLTLEYLQNDIAWDSDTFEEIQSLASRLGLGEADEYGFFQVIPVDEYNRRLAREPKPARPEWLPGTVSD